MATPTVSIHIITFNHEKYIEQAVSSVLAQKVDFDIELIICNDCSTDATDSLIKKIINEHPKGGHIKYYNHNPNIGMMPNFIFALQKCSGKYIAVCEGDDYWIDTKKLQKQVDALEKNSGYSMVITNRKILKENNELCDTAYKKNFFKTADVINGFVPGMQTVLFKNNPSIADYFIVHPEYYFGDRYLAYYSSLFGDILLLPDITAVYRLTGSGVWSANSPLQKLHTYTKFMEDFHISLGIPTDNVILARLGFDASYSTLRYCIKRPRLFANKEYRKLIAKPWKEYKKMNRMKIFFSVLRKRSDKS